MICRLFLYHTGRRSGPAGPSGPHWLRPCEYMEVDGIRDVSPSVLIDPPIGFSDSPESQECLQEWPTPWATEAHNIVEPDLRNVSQKLQNGRHAKSSDYIVRALSEKK